MFKKISKTKEWNHGKVSFEIDEEGTTVFKVEGKPVIGFKKESMEKICEIFAEENKVVSTPVVTSTPVSATQPSTDPVKDPEVKPSETKKPTTKKTTTKKTDEVK